MADVFNPHSKSNENNEEFSENELPARVETFTTGANESLITQNEEKKTSNVDAITYLRSQVAKKDRQVKRERALRRAAEKRELKITSEEYLDPYAGSNPSVNEELKERLSVRAQLNRLLGEREPMEGASQPGLERGNRMADQETTEGTQTDMDMKKDNPHHSTDSSPMIHNKTTPSEHLYPAPGSVTIHAPWLSPHRVVHFDPSLPHSWPHGSSGLHENKSADPSNLQFVSPPGLHHSHGNPMHSTPNKISHEQSLGIPVGIQVNGRIQREDGTPTGIGRAEKSVNITSDLSDGLPFLIEELGTSKDLNKELAEKLSEAEKELETLQIKLELAETMVEAEVAAKGAALVEEIFAAQKQHDQALLARMKVANEERDEALNRVKMTEDGFDSGTDVNSNEEEYSRPDMALQNLVKKLGNANSNMDIHKYGHAIMSHIGGSKDRRNRITSEEMRAIIEEKDAAITQNKKLEREIINLKKRQEDIHGKKNNAESLKAELKTAKKERDASFSQVKKLREELDNLKMYYSLHQSLSQESQLREQFNNSLVTIEDQVKSRDKVLAQTQSENSQLSNQLKAVVGERNSFAIKVQQLEQENALIKQEYEKQERLVAVLRRKVTEGTVKTIN